MFSISRRLARAAPQLRRTPPSGARAITNSGTPPPPTRVMDEGERTIHSKLSARFSPSQLLVQDVSGGCGTFYAITIASPAFNGLPIVKQHRLVTEELKKEIEGIHGLQIKTVAE